MPNEENLIPQNHVLTVEEQSKGGHNSVKKRRRKKTMKQVMSMLLDMPAVTPDDRQLIADIGLNIDDLDEEVTNLLIINAALLMKAKHLRLRKRRTRRPFLAPTSTRVFPRI